MTDIRDVGLYGQRTPIDLVKFSTLGYLSRSTDPVFYADFVGVPTIGPTPLNVDFEDLSYSNGAAISSWLWTFGNGQQSTDQVPLTQEYVGVGQYDVSLTVGRVSETVVLNNPVDIFVSGNTAYLIGVDQGGDGYLQIVDVTNKTNILPLASIIEGDGGLLLDTPSSISVRGDYAYVATVAGLVSIIDISDPTTPVYAGNFQDTNWLPYGNETPRKLQIIGNLMYVITAYSIYVINLDVPLVPVRLGKLSNGDGGITFRSHVNFYVSGDHACITTFADLRFFVVDIGDSSTPLLVGSIFNGENGVNLDFALDVAVDGNYAYLGVHGGGGSLEVVDISNPYIPTHYGSLDDGVGGAILDGPLGIVVNDGYAFIGNGDTNALEIVSVSNPALPGHFDSVLDGENGALLDYPIKLALDGDHLHIAVSNSNAIEIIYVPVPEPPIHSGSLVDGDDIIEYATETKLNYITVLERIILDFISINHYESIINRLPTCRAWRGEVLRIILKVIADQITGITDELIVMSKIKNMILGEDVDLTTLLNGILYSS